MSADVVEKAVVSAYHNLENKLDSGRLSMEDVFVSEAFVNGGPSYKRILPAPQGRAFRIRKRTAHVTIIVSDGVEEEIVEEEIPVDEDVIDEKVTKDEAVDDEEVEEIEDEMDENTVEEEAADEKAKEDEEDTEREEDAEIENK
jgi:hypothetical protein